MTDQSLETLEAALSTATDAVTKAELAYCDKRNQTRWAKVRSAREHADQAAVRLAYARALKSAA